MPEEAHVSIDNSGSTTTITADGTLSFTNSAEFGAKLKQASLNAEKVVVDLRLADFIDTQIIQDLGRAAVAMLKRGRRLKVMVLGSAYPTRVLKISGYEVIMDIEIDQGQAN